MNLFIECFNEMYSSSNDVLVKSVVDSGDVIKVLYELNDAKVIIHIGKNYSKIDILNCFVYVESLLDVLVPSNDKILTLKVNGDVTYEAI